MALPSQNRLRKKKDFDAVFKEGKAIKSASLFVKYRRNLLSESRFGFIMPLKTVGNVATRNRIKRVLSEAIHLRIDSIEKGRDVVITVRKKEKEDILKKEMLELFNIG